MIFALGACVAGLLALLCLPAISRRAMRFAHAAVERQMPISVDEIVAQRDLLRAEFATERRQIEQALEKVREAHAREMGESGRRAAQVGRLSHELADVTYARNVAETAQKAAERFAHETAAENGTLQKALYDADGMETRLREALGSLSREHAALVRDHETLVRAHETLTHAHTEAIGRAATLQSEQDERARSREVLEEAYGQAKLDLSMARAHAETLGAQVDQHEDAMRVALATETDLRRKVADLEHGGSNPADIETLRRTIVEIGREVVRMSEQRREGSADGGQRASTPVGSVH